MSNDQITYHDARTAALFREIESNPDVFLIGGVVTLPGVNPPTPVDEVFPDRVVWTPLSEFSAMSVGVGAAMAGLRPFVPLGTASFMFYGWPAAVLEAPNVRYATGGTVTAPVVFHILTGLRRSTGVDHEHIPQAMLQQIPGLRVYAPGTPAEVDGVLHAALTGRDPTVIADHKSLFPATGSVPATPIDPDLPQLVREGGDGVIVAHSFMVQHALVASSTLATAGVQLSVLSTPLLNPLPVDSILDVVGHHPSAVFVDEARAPGSVSTYLMASMLESGLDLPTRLLATEHAPSPVSHELADRLIPTADKIVDVVESLL